MTVLNTRERDFVKHPSEVDVKAMTTVVDFYKPSSDPVPVPVPEETKVKEFKEVNDEGDPMLGFKCNLCDFVTKSEPAMKRHVTIKHKKDKK